MAEATRYRFVQAEELEAVNQFNKFGLDAWQATFFNARRPHSYLSICEIGEEEVVGTEGYVGYPIRVNGQVRQSHRSELTLVNPKMRGQGVFQQMVELCSEKAIEDESVFCWGATAAMKAFQRAGFRAHSGYRQYYILPLRPGKICWSYFSGTSGLSRNPVRLYKSLRQRNMDTGMRLMRCLAGARRLVRLRTPHQAAPGSDYVTLPQPRNWEDVNALMDQLQGGRPAVAMHHQQELWDWITQDNHSPMLGYFTYRKDELVAWSIVDTGTGNPVQRVLDFGAVDQPACQANLHAVAKGVAAAGTDALAFAINLQHAPMMAYAGILKRLGAVPLLKGGSFVVRPLAWDDESVYRDMSAWYLTDYWLTFFRRN